MEDMGRSKAKTRWSQAKLKKKKARKEQSGKEKGATPATAKTKRAPKDEDGRMLRATRRDESAPFGHLPAMGGGRRSAKAKMLEKRVKGKKKEEEAEKGKKKDHI